MRKNRISSYRPSRERIAQKDAFLAGLPGGLLWPEYPRPHFVRPDWQCLNDGWEQAGVTDILGIHDYSSSSQKFRRRYAQAIAGGPLPRSAGEPGRAIFARDATTRGSRSC